ncbi:MAG: zf-TFIIB domain-containing protein [Firmicutes bacterium]|nr:zf-TFIIB domain-containing protein [Bacillota bacterium]
MDCPSCVLPMNTQIFYNIEIDACKMCGGLWFDRHELAAYIKNRKIPFKLLSGYCLDDRRKIIGEGSRKCPRCQKNMQVVNHIDVNVDYCNDCSGLWFDRGELSKILNYYTEKAGKVKKKPVGQASDTMPDEGWEEVIRVTEDGIIEERIKSPGQNAPVVQTPVNEELLVKGDDPVAIELREGGTIEDIARAMPEQAKKRRESSLPPMEQGYHPESHLNAGIAGTAMTAASGDPGILSGAGDVVVELAMEFAGFVIDLFD